ALKRWILPYPPNRNGWTQLLVPPPLFADQGDETDCSEVLVSERAVGALRDPDEPLHRTGPTQRHHQHPACLQLAEQRLWHMAAARRSENCIVRRPRRPALRPVALDDLDIVVAKPRQPLA